jgi:hypothetical protein
MSVMPWGPERPAGQGIGPAQEQSAARVIRQLLTDPVVGEQVDLVLCHRQGDEGNPSAGAGDGQGQYEAWARRGMVCFRRVIDASGALDFELLEVRGENPLANQDPHALCNLDQERAAAKASGFDADDPSRRFIAPAHQSYPFAYERVAQLFDSPHAPDLAISVRDWCFGSQPGTHGALHVRQSRAPLWFVGPGITPGVHPHAARAVDIAPTALAALGFPKIDGRDATGRRASERGVEPDVLLLRQDGRVLEEILAKDDAMPRYLHIFLLDGLHQTELDDRLASSDDDLPNLRWLRERAAVLQAGSIVNFPSITWPSHTTIGTGSWCGHHHVVHPSYYLREKRETISPQGQQIGTEGFSSREVESIYEAFERVRGEDCLTAAIFAPFGRGADHAVLERRNLCNKSSLRELHEELRRDEDPRWAEDGFADAIQESGLDTRGVAQLYDLFRRDDIRSPDLVFQELILTDGVGHDYGPHGEGIRAALDESDRRIGRILTLLEEHGRLDETLFVVTADHGMAPQDITLNANPGRFIKRNGTACVVADTMIWLLDLALEPGRAPDGRTGRVIVRENDRLASGERPAVEGAQVVVDAHHASGEVERIAQGITADLGIFGFATPVEIGSAELWIEVSAEGFNPRRIRLDGTREVDDLRSELYGAPEDP